MIPAKADPNVQAAYLQETLEPRLAEAQAGKRAVFFVDAAHCVLAPFLGLPIPLLPPVVPAALAGSKIAYTFRARRQSCPCDSLDLDQAHPE